MLLEHSLFLSYISYVSFCIIIIVLAPIHKFLIFNPGAVGGKGAGPYDIISRELICTVV